MTEASTGSRPKRVLYVENGIGYGGAIICLRHLVRNLDRDRYIPMVVTGRTGPEYREIADEAPWRHIPDRRVDIPGWRARVESSERVKAVLSLGPIVNQVLARLDDVGNFLPFFLSLLKAARAFRPDLIHVNNEPLCNRAGVLVGKALRVPVISHVRGNLDGSWMMRWAYRLPDHFIPVSHWVSEGIGGLGVRKSRRTVVYDGLELEHLDTGADGSVFRQCHEITENAFAVGLVGLLIPWKGQDIFLDAARELRDEIPNLRMLIVGGTPEECAEYERGLRERVRREGLADTVVFTGHVSDMPAVYNGLDVLVSASTSPEPLGTMVIETMTMARPLIVPNHGGGSEMTEHGETALKFQAGDACALAQAIRSYHGNPELRARLGKAARKKALRTFAVAQHVRNVQAVYDRVLARPR